MIGKALSLKRPIASSWMYMLCIQIPITVILSEYKSSLITLMVIPHAGFEGLEVDPTKTCSLWVPTQKSATISTSAPPLTFRNLRRRCQTRGSPDLAETGRTRVHCQVIQELWFGVFVLLVPGSLPLDPPQPSAAMITAIIVLKRWRKNDGLWILFEHIKMSVCVVNTVACQRANKL